MQYSTYIKIYPDIIERNTKKIADYVYPAKVIAVVKGDGYGHGLGISALAAKQGGASIIAVSCVNEAILLKRETNIKDILCLSPPTNIGECESIASLQCAITIDNMHQAKLLEKASRIRRKKIKTHIEIDTGIGWSGIHINRFKELFVYVINSKSLILTGVFSHLNNGSDIYRTNFQYNNFNRTVQGVPKARILFHLCNSSAIFLNKNFHLNAVRVGRALYGLIPASIEMKTETAMTWYSKISNIHSRTKGSSFGYHPFKILKNSMIIGTIPVGYVHGYPRLSVGPILYKDIKVPIIGDINMQNFSVELTHTQNAKVNDPVVLYGSNKKNEITINELRKHNKHIISNQFTCCIAKDIPRIVESEKSIYRI